MPADSCRQRAWRICQEPGARFPKTLTSAHARCRISFLYANQTGSRDSEERSDAQTAGSDFAAWNQLSHNKTMDLWAEDQEHSHPRRTPSNSPERSRSLVFPEA